MSGENEKRDRTSKLVKLDTKCMFNRRTRERYVRPLTTTTITSSANQLPVTTNHILFTAMTTTTTS